MEGGFTVCYKRNGIHSGQAKLIEVFSMGELRGDINTSPSIMKEYGVHKDTDTLV